MSPTLTGLAALLASASVAAPTTPTESSDSVDFSDAETEDPAESIAGLDAPAAVKSAAGPKVHIESPRPVELFVVTGEATAVSGNGSAYAVSYERVCDSPCDTRVPTRPDYFVGGRGVTPSPRFRVRDGEDVTLDVRPGRPGLRWAGWLSATAGITMIVLGATFRATNLGKPSSNNGLIAGGSVLTAGSIPMFIFGRTRVKTR
jgi:hypothetical protein